MKGVVFTELFDFVEESFDPVFLQESIEASKVPSKGVYTATGTYPACEIGALVTSFSDKSGLSIPDLMKAYGRHLFARFNDMYPEFFEGVEDAFSFLVHVEDVIHGEVRKLHADAELPRFEFPVRTDTHLQIIYRSSRHFGDLCEGLIQGCLDFYGEKGRIDRAVISEEPGSIIQFDIIREAK